MSLVSSGTSTGRAEVDHDEKRSIVNHLRVFYAQFTLGSPHSFIYLGPGGAIKSAINHLNIGP